MNDNRGTRHCPRCQARHRNWDKCPRDPGPDDLRGPPPGYRIWTHKMVTMERRGGDNVLQFPNKKAHRIGQLTDPPTPDAA